MSETVFLNREKQFVKLSDVIQLSNDTSLFRFSLPEEDKLLGLPVGKHIKVHSLNPKGKEEGKWNNKEDLEKSEEIQRNYTPISLTTTRGHFDFVIKQYKGGINPNYPDGGKISQYIHSLKIGDQITISGAWGLVEYKGKGIFTWKGKKLEASNLLMIAGGTGITPMYQIIQSILADSSDLTKISLLYSNHCKEDILLRKELDLIASNYQDQIKICYTITRSVTKDGDEEGDDWPYYIGRINREMIGDLLPGNEDRIVLLCGPNEMLKSCLLPILQNDFQFPLANIITC